MGLQTYQESHCGSQLEQYEWTRIWFENTYDITSKRVAYIGDSICECTHQFANLMPDRQFVFNNIASSKAVDHPNYYASIAMFLSENEKLDAIIINNGLHGWHLSEEEYGRLYGEAVHKLHREYPNTPMWIVLTTAISESNECCGRVPARNVKALEIAEKEGIGVIDLYTVSAQIAHLRKPDGVHFQDDGYRALAQEILSVLAGVM